MKTNSKQFLTTDECALTFYLAIFFLFFFAWCTALGWVNQVTPVASWSRLMAFPMAVIGSMAVALAVSGTRKDAAPPLAGLLVLAGLLYASSWFMDLSWDGLGYHQRAVIAILKGVSFLSTAEPVGDLWVDNYAKATWFYGATLISWFGRTEFGASYHFVLAAAALFYMYGFCREVGRGRVLSSIVVIIAFCNPVTLAQWFTYYNDAALGSLGILLIFSAILVAREDRRLDRVVFVASAVLAVNVKASGIILVGAAFLYLGLAVLWQSQSFLTSLRKIGLPLTLFCGLGIGVLGYSPYIQNLSQGRHIFYPLMGVNSADIMTENSPHGFPEKNRFHALFLSVFSKSEDLLAAVSEEVPTLKIPGRVSVNEITEFWRTDLRIGGFGPLYSLVFVLGLLSFLALRLDWRVAGPLTFMVVVGVAVNPYAWWARYSPILWIFPLIPLITMRGARFRMGTLVPALLVLAMAVNIGMLLWSWARVHPPTNFYLKGVAQSMEGKTLKIYQGRFASDLLIESLGFKYEKVSKEYYERNKGKFVDLIIGISYERD